MSTNKKTLKELSQQVLDAVNLCGVAQSFARAMIDLSEHCNGTEERNEHPITKAWVKILSNLSGGLSPYTIAQDCKIIDQIEEWAKQ